MAKKSKLLLALDAQKGRDYVAEKQKKQQKAGEKRKREKEIEKKKAKEDAQPAMMDDDDDEAEDAEDVWESESEDENEDEDVDEDELEQPTTTSTKTKPNNTIPQPTEPASPSASEADPDSDVPLSDLDQADLEDTIPHQRLTINNIPALKSSTKRIAIVPSSSSPSSSTIPFQTHNSLISDLPPPSTTIPDPNDDLTRELEFYRIAKEATTTARDLYRKSKIPFSRPADYFAEMVKTDEHMDKIKKKMYNEAAGKKASEEAKKLRDAKKFGKAVQVAKEQERAREKRGTLEKIKELKRKRKGNPSTTTTENDNDLFQEIAVDNTTTTTTSSFKRDRSGRERGGDRDGDRSAKRQKRDAKYGFGGKKRFSKSGDAVSSGDLSGFSASRMKGKGGRGGGGGGGGRGRGRGGGGVGGSSRGGKRLGKSRRVAGRS